MVEDKTDLLIDDSWVDLNSSGAVSINLGLGSIELDNKVCTKV